MDKPTTTLQGEDVRRSRGVERLVAGQDVMDGAGVRISRVLTQPLQRRLDPFLMLDAFRSDQPGDYIAGFPAHPHRGFETVTYMLAGRMRHRDNAGNEGLVTNGGVQWMTAGRGVVHSEMPEQEEGLMAGFQLWLNLPAADKMTAPWYRDLPAEALPRFALEGGAQVTIIAGASHGVQGAVQREATRVLYLDIALPAGASFAQALPADHNAFIYVIDGEVAVEGKAVPARRMAILAHAQRVGEPAAPDAPDGVRVTAARASRLLLLAGRPLNEPIAQYGPFVMNTNAEVFAAVEDFRAGRFG
jgi:redox-sensitive bicupin YhaK (pirin superfamily)